MLSNKNISLLLFFACVLIYRASGKSAILSDALKELMKEDEAIELKTRDDDFVKKLMKKDMERIQRQSAGCSFMDDIKREYGNGKLQVFIFPSLNGCYKLYSLKFASLGL